MFVGHFALGFAAKRAAPRIPLSLLFIGVQFADILWPILVALGLEQVRIDPGNTAMTPMDFVSYPYSHSLLFLVIWGVILAVICRAPILAGLVVSHWVLDFVTHRPDMPLYPGSTRLGLGLWNSVPATLVVEFALYGVGLWLYATSTRASDRIGRWALVGMAVFMVIAYLGAMNGPPPNITAVWVTGLVGAAILLAWAHWMERHRRIKAA